MQESVGDKKWYDFYTVPEGIHFLREYLTKEKALAYARKYKLRFEEMKK